MIEKSRAHLEERNETYFEHMQAATQISIMLSVMSLKCLVHAIFPSLYATAVSDRVECLKELTNR